MLKNVLKKLLRDQTRPTADAHIGFAREHLHNGRPLQAMHAADAALALSPQQAEALYLRGTACLETGNAVRALPDLKRATELCPSEPRYLFNLAVAHWQLGDGGAAVSLCRQIVARQDFPKAHVFLANIELPGELYLDVLSRVHGHLRPATYLEIGVATGLSMSRAHPETAALGVDPSPQLEAPLGPLQRVFAETSDDFFARHDVIAELGGRRVDMAFIDGMHRFEFALRDFANIERLSRYGTVVLIHDCWPLDRRTAERERCTHFWSGDIWRLILLLKKYRSDLGVHTIGAPPTGLGIVINLDPSSRLLEENHQQLVAEYLALDYSYLEDGKKEKLGFVADDWSAIQRLLDSRRGA
jgi:tetratricopeptide (TPR) repeat protein